MGLFSARSRAPLAIIIAMNETLIEHLGEDDLSLLDWRALGFQLSVLLLESCDKEELLFDSMLLGESLELVVLDLLLGPSPFRADLHQVGSSSTGLCIIKKMFMKTKPISYLRLMAVEANAASAIRDCIMISSPCC